jgi:transposase
MISRSGHAAIRHSLYMPAMVALKYNPLIKAFGLRLKGEGLAPKAVISASMHKLVRLIYGVLKSRIVFNPQFFGNRLDFQDGI